MTEDREVLYRRRQFPCDFEFNISYLFKLAQHTYSSLFGTFLCNSLQERRQHRVAEETRSQRYKSSVPCHCRS
jgi:hypothetical protein